MLLQNARVRALVTLLTVTLLSASTGMYFYARRGHREHFHAPKISTTCILQLGVDDFTETHWIAESETKVASESVSVFTVDGEGIWGSRNVEAINEVGLIAARDTGLDQDIHFFLSKTENGLFCKGSYGGFDFNGTSQVTDIGTDKFLGAPNTFNCFAEFTCKRHTTHCHAHPEALGCPETSKMRHDYEHGECLLYLREYFEASEAQGAKKHFDVYINDPTGRNLLVDIIGLTSNGNATMQKRLEHPLTMHVGQNDDTAVEFNYNADNFVKDGALSNDRCTVSKRDEKTNTRDSTCKFQC